MEGSRPFVRQSVSLCAFVFLRPAAEDDDDDDDDVDVLRPGRMFPTSSFVSVDVTLYDCVWRVRRFR